MSLPDRNNPYSFDDFLKWRHSFDYCRDDPFIQKVARKFCLVFDMRKFFGLFYRLHRELSVS